MTELRGKQLVSDGYLTEARRLGTIDEYARWCDSEARSMRLHLRAIHAQR